LAGVKKNMGIIKVLFWKKGEGFSGRCWIMVMQNVSSNSDLPD
jgi:hypothetical protein